MNAGYRRGSCAVLTSGRTTRVGTARVRAARGSTSRRRSSAASASRRTAIPSRDGRTRTATAFATTSADRAGRSTFRATSRTKRWIAAVEYAARSGRATSTLRPRTSRANRSSRLPRRLRATASATMRSTSTASSARCGSTTKRRGPNLSTSGRSSLGTSARATRARAFASVRPPTSTPATVTPRATVCAREASSKYTYAAAALTATASVPTTTALQVSQLLIAASASLDDLETKRNTRRMRYQFVDCRWELGNPARGGELYRAGHIPGASFLDVDEDLSDLSVPDAGRHPLPTAGRFAAAASRAGIGEGVFVVAYGNGGGAERLWWLLRHFGHDDCAVVDVGSWHGPLTAGAEPAQ